MGEQWCAGVEQEVEALGKTWRLSRQTRGVWRAFAEWARGVLPDPIEAVARHIDKLALQDAAVMRELMRQDLAEMKERGAQAVTVADKYQQLAETTTSKALDKAASYLNFGGPELLSLVLSPVGQVRMLFLLLRKHHATVTEDDADDILNEIGPKAAAALFKKAGGSVPERPKNAGSPAA